MGLLAVEAGFGICHISLYDPRKAVLAWLAPENPVGEVSREPKFDTKDNHVLALHYHARRAVMDAGLEERSVRA